MPSSSRPGAWHKGSNTFAGAWRRGLAQGLAAPFHKPPATTTPPRPQTRRRPGEDGHDL